MVTCVAEPKSGSQEVGTQSNPNLMEGKMFRGEGGNGLTLRKFLVFLFELLANVFCMEIWIFVFFMAYTPVFFKKMTHTP